MAVQQINKKTFDEFMARQDKPVLVEFQAPWCVYCRRIAPALDQIAEQRGGKLEVVKVDIDDEPQLSDAQGVELVPTLILYSKGEALGSLVAPDSAAKVDAFLRERGV